MADEPIRETFSEVATAVHLLFEQVTDWEAPGLGSWDVAGLAGHLIRNAALPARYLAADPPTAAEATQVVDAAGYFSAYVPDRDQLADSIAARATEEAAGVDPDKLPDHFAAAYRLSRDAIAEVAPDQLLRTPFGTIACDEYVRSRVLELTVHGLDLAHAIGASWQPPESALRVTLQVLAEIALSKPERALQLVLWMTGRDWADPAEASAVLG